MSHGRIARASRRYPDAKRRAARYGRTLHGRRPTGLPPHLLPGASRRGAATDPRRWLFLGAAMVLAAMLFAAGASIISTGAAVGGTLAAYEEVNANLPNAGQVAMGTFETTRIFDRNGKLLQEVSDPDYGWRTFVPLKKISRHMIDATIAAEDATYWTNYGVEPVAIARGVMINLGGSGSSGASTITQQLVRSLYPEDIGYDVSYTRKAKEALAAIALNRQYSKHDILTMYLNQIYYGERSYGIEAAAQTYFTKHASELTLGEASLLAGLPQAPSYYDPVIPEGFERAKQRQRYVLDQMIKHRYITKEEAEAAWLEPLRPKSRSGAIQAAPHFVNYVREYIAETYGEEALYHGGLQITTTIDVALQERAEAIVREGVAQVAAYDRNNAAMVAMVPWSGEILAMVGSANFDDPLIDGQFNQAVGLIQPGSSIKPLAYAAAFESGWHPGTVVMDITYRKPTPGAPDPYYEPQNYSGQFYGAVSVRTALSNSFNISAVKALEYAGGEHMIDLARRMGMKESLPEGASHYGLSLALGSGEVQLLELANVYGTFANNGKYVPANPILKITDSQGNVLYELDREDSLKHAEQALKAEHAYQITSILTDSNARSLVFGRGNLFEQTQDRLGRPTAAKSGTTDNWKDIWTMGYTTDLVVGVWVGKTGGNTQYLPEMDGIQGAGPIWNRMMVEMHENPQFAKLLLGPDGRPVPRTFQRPPDIYEGQICAVTGHRATGGGATRTELLVRGEGPALRCDQLSAHERAELKAALADVKRNPGRYSGPAVDSVYRYADAVGYLEGSQTGFDDSMPTVEGR